MSSVEDYDYILLSQTFKFRNIGYLFNHISILAEGLSRTGKKVAIAFITRADYLLYKYTENSIKSTLQFLPQIMYDAVFFNNIGFKRIYPLLNRAFGGSSMDIPSNVDLLFGEKELYRGKVLVVNGYVMANYLLHSDFVSKPVFYIIYHQYEKQSNRISKLVHATYNSSFHKIFTSRKLLSQFNASSERLMPPAILKLGDPSRNYLSLKKKKSVLIPLRAAWIKGPDVAISVINYLYNKRPDIKVTTFGNLSRRKRPGNANNRGIVTDEELVKLYEENEIFVITSRVDGVPGPAAEAMSRGCAVVCTDVSGAREIIDNRENGEIVEVENPIAISKAIIRLVDNDELRSKFVQNSRETIQKFTSGNMIGSFIKIVERYSET